MAKDRRNSNGLGKKWKLGRQEIEDVPIVKGPDKPLVPVYYGYDAKILADNPIGYWKLNEPTGQIIKDHSTAGRDGRLTGNVQLGQSGPTADGATSALFDGSTGFNKVFGYDPLNGATAFSMEGWVNHNGAAWNATLDIFFSLGAIGHYLSVSSGLFFTSVRISGVQKTTTSTLLATSGWHHLVQTWTSGETIKLYINGVLATTGVVASGAVDSSPHVYHGIFEPTTATNRFTGSISRCALYNYALSPLQIATHYAARNDK